jgi:hypothetical protein
MAKRLPSVRAVPWATVLTVGLQVAREGKKRWERLSKRDQEDLLKILRKVPRGPSAITAHDRARVRKIVGKVASLD